MKWTLELTSQAFFSEVFILQIADSKPPRSVQSPPYFMQVSLWQWQLVGKRMLLKKTHYRLLDWLQSVGWDSFGGIWKLQRSMECAFAGHGYCDSIQWHFSRKLSVRGIKSLLSPNVVFRFFLLFVYCSWKRGQQYLTHLRQYEVLEDKPQVISSSI